MLSAVMVKQLKHTRRSSDESLQGVCRSATPGKAIVAVYSEDEVDGQA